MPGRYLADNQLACLVNIIVVSGKLRCVVLCDGSGCVFTDSGIM